MIIDAHIHIFSPEMRGQREKLCQRDARFAECYHSPKARMVNAEELITVMDAAKVRRAVVIGFAFDDGLLCRASNDYIIEAVQRYPHRLIGLGAVQPLDGDPAGYEVERCFAAGLSGLGELSPDGQQFDLTERRVMEPLAELLVKGDKPLLIHASEPMGHPYGGKGQTTPEKILRLAENFPKLKIIAAHWGGGLLFYELMPEVRSSLTNLYYDTAATTYLYRFEIFRVALAACGLEKILFASDYPVLGPARLLERIRKEAQLTPPELKAILGGNAARLFGLTESERSEP
ncbi:MAG: amidohydrolase family protein [Chloroflexota bacterium]